MIAVMKVRSILSISTEHQSKSKINKSKVMPTWAATNSLLLLGKKVTKTNSEVLPPLLRRPPTDFASLYTSLKLVQEVSAVVVGPNKKPIITLDMDLFQRAVKIK